MCDMRKISEKRESLLKDINETISASGATIALVEKEMAQIEKKAKENIHSLSLLL